LGGEVRDGLFKEIIQKLPERPNKENLPNKILKAYAKLKDRAEVRKAKRKQNKREWKPQIGDQILVKGQTVSDACQGVTAKFQKTLLGPF
jgi:hypothetical protein